MEFKETFGEMEDFKSVVEFQSDISHRFREDFNSLISLYESLSDIYLSTVKKLQDRIDSQERDTKNEITFLLMARIFNHSLSAFTLLERGMLIDGAAVIRHVLETQWLLEYFYENPDKIDSWMEGKQIKPSEVRRNLKLDEERSFLYGEYCKMTHNNIEAARYYSGSQGDSDCIIFGGYYNPLYIEQLLNELIIYITTTLFIVNYAYQEELQDLKAVNRKLNSMLKVIIRRLAEISHMEEA
ncbi:MAG: hypothetical protein D5R97_04410 [Candidatus Syntrophonatronum acetioxidans]|uniref:Uncharacterized protein n=1 Tax=Candidatus Syntrophonatronum acetioxidans TaxID=1795816 RepID=A0A424YFC1_9FIRM|nr:MAG: hypothetical protein D5R97_04410 [Candidatus Syntrophonatronum acetioxidans]